MENKLRKFKLIDKECYFSNCHINKKSYDEYFSEEGTVEGYVREGYLFKSDSHGSIAVIAPSEWGFFEEILPEQEYWKENTPLEKSLLVGKKCQGEKAFQIEHVGEEIVLLKEVTSGKESCTTKDNLKSLLPDEEEILFQKVLSKWKGLTLDNAYDHRGSVVNLERFYDVVKEVFDEHYKS